MKNYNVQKVKYLWRLASEHQNIDNIVVIGYSFSEQDPQVRMLLRVMLESGRLSSDIPVLLVNRNSSKDSVVRKRINKIFNKSEILWNSPTSYFFQEIK